MLNVTCTPPRMISSMIFLFTLILSLTPPTKCLTNTMTTTFHTCVHNVRPSILVVTYQNLCVKKHTLSYNSQGQGFATIVSTIRTPPFIEKSSTPIRSSNFRPFITKAAREAGPGSDNPMPLGHRSRHHLPTHSLRRPASHD